MDASFGGGGFTQSGAGDAKKESKTEGTLPMFISQIHQQKDAATVSMWGFEYKLVTIVALVRNIQHSSTKITYDLEDITGTIAAHFWVDEEQTPMARVVNINSYVRVIGNARQQGDTKMLMIFHISPIKSINQINSHYLEVVNARYQAEDYYRGGSEGFGTAMKMETETTTQATAATTQNTMKDGKGQAVYKAIQASAASHPERGVARDDLCRTFSHISSTEMSRILDNLLEEGHIYSTIDADHFLACF